MTAPHEGWNPRYEAYAAAHGRDPDAMLEHDRAAWPGGSMTGYIVWTHRVVADWRKAHGLGVDHPLSPEQQVECTAWLRQRSNTSEASAQTLLLAEHADERNGV